MPQMPSHRRKKKKLPDCPEPSEIEAMLRVTSGWVHVAIALAAYAGLRCGEVRALEVRDIDWDARRIVVRRAMSANVVTTTKSDKERIVPIAPGLEPILRQACTGKKPSDRVVLTREGTTPSRQKILYRLTRTQKRHGLRHRSFHSLRHHFCTTLLQRGADIELVRVVAGHHDLTTAIRYLHAHADDARRFMGRIRAEHFVDCLN